MMGKDTEKCFSRILYTKNVFLYIYFRLAIIHKTGDNAARSKHKCSTPINLC